MACFTPYVLNNVHLKNRFARSATAEFLCENGFINDRTIGFYENLAKGRLGMIITSHAAVTEQGRAAASTQILVDADDKIPGLRRLTDICHAHDTPIVIQLAHAGVVAAYPNPLKCNDMTLEDFDRLAEAFVAGARRAKEAGFDGVQLHAAHGYMLSQILSPLANKRTDRYGGTAEQRAAFPCEVVRRIRALVGPNFLVMCKINVEDFKEGGNQTADTFQILTAMQQAGLDAAELSGGFGEMGLTIRTGILPQRPNPAHPEYYHAAMAQELRRLGLRLPLILVGGVRNRARANELVSQGTVEMLSISRPLICEPDLVGMMEHDPNKLPKCVSCNRCFSTMPTGLRCATFHPAPAAAAQ
eukprot:GAFH01002627.1.p1 GENE.GAFH01002627.1~~GAFH01002627.1.p1  ORF type:complete len:358 (-),score=77.39 GAFH01002627.1:41-1114(-)